jgi:hypothetical protein
MQIYILSSIPYSFLRQRPQQIADQLVARSIPVTYVEPCGLTEYLAGRKKGLVRLLLASVLFQLLGILGLLFPPLGRKPRPAEGKGKTAARLSIVSMPIILPHDRVDSVFLERLNASVYRQVLKWRVFRRMVSGEESIAIVQNPFWGLVLRKGDFSRLSYDCVDEITLFSGKASAGRYEAYEAKLMEMASVAFVTAEMLEENLHWKYPAVPLVRIPNGVDPDGFQEQALSSRVPEDIAAVGSPVIGYVGALSHWVDYDLVGFLAKAMPEASVVMVGPLDVEGRIAHLKGIPNLYWLGRKEYEEIPLYVRAFDVCLIPFATGKIALTTNPVKVFEYFALGKPVVTTALHELQAFRREGLLRIAEGKEAFCAAVREALAEKDATLLERRREAARRHSWLSLTDRMMASLFPQGTR